MNDANQPNAYRHKRDPDRTPEPFGNGAQVDGPMFVIQQHDATNMHWDLRLQAEGVLESWAVPKGPSTDPREKRLAVPTEDHPLDVKVWLEGDKVARGCVLTRMRGDDQWLLIKSAEQVTKEAS